MCNGAAGCGYEYRNTGGKCGRLSQLEGKFKCGKYHTDLDVHFKTKEPFRCQKCLDSV